MTTFPEVLDTIGNTPLVRLRSAPGVLVKVEGGNPTGSYKDRMALAMITGAERRGALHPGQRVVEYSGGSTGSSLAFVCAVKGYPLTVVSSDAFSPEKLRTMRAFGAEVIVVPNGGVITPDLFVRMRAEVDRIVASTGAFWTDQFNNRDALDGYEVLGREIAAAAGPIDAFCAAVGTGGMLVGAVRGLRGAGAIPWVVALEPDTSPTLTTGTGGPHRVEGTATGIVPPLLVAGSYDEARVVDEAAARSLASRLARVDGLFAGVSTALNVAGATALAAERGPDRTVVTVAVDTGLEVPGRRPVRGLGAPGRASRLLVHTAMRCRRIFAPATPHPSLSPPVRSSRPGRTRPARPASRCSP